MTSILIIEPFYGGSHKQLLDTILPGLNESEYDLLTLPAKKWHWRARISALYFADQIKQEHNYRTIFTTSVLNLAELVALRTDIVKCRKIVYFHENQLCYPTREVKQRDFQYGYNQILSCLCADKILFNSQYNMKSFLVNIKEFLNIQPDLKIRGIREKIESKSEVLYFPIQFDRIPKFNSLKNCDYLHIIWPHRWEHDKNPDLLIATLNELVNKGVDFRISILGERTTDVPECFHNINEKLKEKIVRMDFLSKEDYFKTLYKGDVVLSTANHEFYGVAMLEAVYCGCVPLAPNKLVYPEIYQKSQLYNTSNQLIKLLSNWCRNRKVFEKNKEDFFRNFDFQKFLASKLTPVFVKYLKSDDLN